MRLELVIHLSREDAKTQERIAVATERAADALVSIDQYFKRINRATEAHITIGEITEQEAPK